MKAFIEVKSRFEFSLPSWYDVKLHNQVIEILSNKSKGKLHACKFLRDTSNKMKEEWNGMDGESQEMFLKEAKELCDFIVDVDGLMKGKIVSVPVKEVIEGMQVLFNETILFVKNIRSNGRFDLRKDDKYDGYSNTTLEDFSGYIKTLVMEYDKSIYEPAGTFRGTMVQLPLKYSQWESVLKNGEADTDIMVRFVPVVTNIESNSLTIAMLNNGEPLNSKCFDANEVRKIAIEFADRCLNSPSDVRKAKDLQELWTKWYVQI